MTNKRLAFFFTGAILGATAMILTTPITGRRLRRALRYKIEDCSDQLAEVKKNAQHTGNQIRHQGERMVRNAERMFRRSQLRAARA